MFTERLTGKDLENFAQSLMWVYLNKEQHVPEGGFNVSYSKLNTSERRITITQNGYNSKPYRLNIHIRDFTVICHYIGEYWRLAFPTSRSLSVFYLSFMLKTFGDEYKKEYLSLVFEAERLTEEVY